MNRRNFLFTLIVAPVAAFIGTLKPKSRVDGWWIEDGKAYTIGDESQIRHDGCIVRKITTIRPPEAL